MIKYKLEYTHRTYFIIIINHYGFPFMSSVGLKPLRKFFLCVIWNLKGSLNLDILILLKLITFLISELMLCNFWAKLFQVKLRGSSDSSTQFFFSLHKNMSLQRYISNFQLWFSSLYSVIYMFILGQESNLY